MGSVVRAATIGIDEPVETSSDVGRTGRFTAVSPGDLLFILATAVVFGWASLQNFYRLSRMAMRYDEPEYAAMGWRYVHWGSLPPADRLSAWSNFEHPPLAKLFFGVAQWLLGHPSITAARAVSAACTLLAAVVLGCWLARVVNRWAGLLAGAMLALIPMTVVPDLTRFGRSAMLDPVAQLFMVLSVVLGWFWFQYSGRRSWVLAIVAGAAAGLAAASKENGFLGLLLPVVLGFVWSLKSRQKLAIRLAQVAAAATAAGLIFFCCYLPFGDPIGRIRYLLQFQSRHSQNGHLVGLAGRVTDHPPWWANLYFADHGLGLALSLVLACTALAALVLRRDRLVAWCAAALAGPSIFHSFVARVVLSFYWVLWMPFFIALAALGMVELFSCAARGRRRSWRLTAGLAASVAVVLVAIPTLAQTATVVHLKREGASAVPGIRAQLDLRGAILTAGVYLPEIAPFFSGTPILSALPRRLQMVDTVLIGQPRCSTLVDPSVRAFVETDLRSGSIRLVRSDRLLRVYVAVARLHPPTRAEIVAQPLGRLSDNC